MTNRLVDMFHNTSSAYPQPNTKYYETYRRYCFANLALARKHSGIRQIRGGPNLHLDNRRAGTSKL